MSKNELRNNREEKLLNESMLNSNQLKNYLEDLKKSKNSTVQDSNKNLKPRLTFKVQLYISKKFNHFSIPKFKYNRVLSQEMYFYFIDKFSYY